MAQSTHSQRWQHELQAEERLAKRRSQAAQPAGDASEEDEAEVSSYNRERGQILEVRCKHTIRLDVSVLACADSAGAAAVPAGGGCESYHVCCRSDMIHS